MPVTLPSNSVVTVRHEYALGSDVSYNVLHYRMFSSTDTLTCLPPATEPLASEVLPALAFTAFAAWTPAWEDIASEQVSQTGCTVQKTFPGDRSIPYLYLPEVAPIGANESETLPMQDAVTVLKKTGYGQRWGIGRIFLSGIPESFTDSGIVNNAYVAALADLLVQLEADLTHTVGGIAYVWRPVVTNVPTTLFPRVNDIVSVALSNTTIKSQKRRRPGKGI